MSGKGKKEVLATPSEKKVKQPQKKVSKTWIAFQKNIGTGEIIDMRAVLK